MPMGSNELEGLTLAHGRYLITSKLGEGGMGTVYRAQDRNIESDVVVKIPRQAMMDDPEFATRFTREIRSLVKLSHPHIVKVSDVGTWENTPFAVMQFLPGGSLEDRRPTAPDGQPVPCDPKTVPRWLDAVAQALDYIHAQGYVHRDVKPGNILFDSQGHAFLSDFGVAKVLASAADKHASQTAMTGAGMVLGTPEYMAPELIMGEAFDGRVDQYALAVTVYELLCGRRPFEDETKTRILVLHTSKAVPRLTEWCPELPEPLSLAVLKGLSKDPKERYPSCVALAAAIAATTAGAIAREGRVRLKCSQCGKTGGMAAADYARLRESGGRPSCSVCKLPLDLVGGGNESTTATNVRAGGTMLISQPGGSTGFPPAVEPETNRAGITGFAAAARGGTMPMAAPKSDAEKPTDPEPRPITPRRASQTMIERPLAPSDDPDARPSVPRRASQTMIERPLAPADDPEARPIAPRRASKTMIERPLSPAELKAEAALAAINTSESRTVAAPARSQAGDAQGAGAPHSIPAQAWIAIGAGAAATLVGLVFAVMWLIPRDTTSRATLGSSANAPAVAVAPPQKPVLPPEVSTKTAPKPVETAANQTAVKSDPATPAFGGDDQPETQASASDAGLAANDTAEKEPAPTPPQRLVAANIPAPKRAPVKNAPVSFDPANLKMRPVKKFPLHTILASSRSYANQLVTPTGMFQLTHSPTDHVDGRRKYMATDRSVGGNNPTGMSSSASVDLVVEPRLAERLDVLGPRKFRDNMSILTLWFTPNGEPMLVKVEILNSFHLTFKKATVYPEGDLEYQSLQISPVEEVVGKAPDEQWETPERLHHFAKVYKRRVGMFKRMITPKENNQIHNIMHTIYRDMLKGNAAREMQDR